MSRRKQLVGQTVSSASPACGRFFHSIRKGAVVGNTKPYLRNGVLNQQNPATGKLEGALSGGGQTSHSGARLLPCRCQDVAHILGSQLGVLIDEVDAHSLAVHYRQRMAQLKSGVSLVADVV